MNFSLCSYFTEILLQPDSTDSNITNKYLIFNCILGGYRLRLLYRYYKCTTIYPSEIPVPHLVSIYVNQMLNLFIKGNLMRYFTLPSIILGTAISTMTFAAETETLNYNLVNVQAEATRQVSNDEMHAVLYIEKSNKQPAELAAQITQLMNQAIATAKKYPDVKIETGSQTTYPVYDNDSRKLKEWRGRAEINIESTNFKSASQLVSELQQNFQTQSINFSVSDAQRKKVENELMIEASKNFQQRAQMLTQAWSKTGYNLVNLNLNTSSNYPQPVMMRASMAKFANEDSAAQNVASGESKITVNANGTIQFK